MERIWANSSLACLLSALLSYPTSPLAPANPSDAVAAARTFDATLLRLDAAGSRVTYRDAGTGEVKTASVASPAVLEELARMRGGQRVSLTCLSATTSGETVVLDVKRKAKQWKRGIILGLIVEVIAFLAEYLGFPGL